MYMKNTGCHIDLGEEVLDQRTGRIGRTVQVRRDDVWLQFPGDDRHSNLPRARLIPIRTLRALEEVDEDDANHAEYVRSQV